MSVISAGAAMMAEWVIKINKHCEKKEEKVEKTDKDKNLLNPANLKPVGLTKKESYMIKM
jgi:hypothetical protein